MSSMAPILFGAVVFAASLVWLWFMISRPEVWSRLVDRENAFWGRLGAPVKLTEAVKIVEKGLVLKGIVSLIIICAVLMMFEPALSPLILPHRHG